MDFLPDIDGNLVSPRTNLDNVKNSHGDSFITFLKDNRTVMLNGRITPQYNNFTFVTPRGASVPDYMICPAENLHSCIEFKVLLMSDIVNTFKLQPLLNLPDHSFLFSSFSTYQIGKNIYLSNSQKGPRPACPKKVPKKDLS